MTARQLQRLRWVAYFAVFWVPVLCLQLLAEYVGVPWWLFLGGWLGLAVLAGTIVEWIDDEVSRRRWEERVARRIAEAEHPDP